VDTVGGSYPVPFLEFRGWLRFDVTSLYRAWVDGSTENLGVEASIDNSYCVNGDEFVVYTSDYLDTDGDGVLDVSDNCPTIANLDQSDQDGDGLGNACDPCPLDAGNDGDADGVCGNLDNCPGSANSDQIDRDADGDGDACDPCPLDGANDADGDAVCGDVDNCPTAANPDQSDSDGDGAGDACDTTGPDLLGAWRSMVTYNSGKTVKGTLRVSNVGDRATVAFRVSYWLMSGGASRLLSTAYVSGIQARSYRDVYFSYTSTTSLKGKQIVAAIDSLNQVRERNEGNNAATTLVP
jgi:hypothetical protein